MMFHPVLAAILAFVIASITSVGGLSGAFLLLPFQVSVLGFTSPAVTPTNHLYNVVAIPGGIWGYVREGRMLWPLSLIVVLGTIPGVILGSWGRIFLLPKPEHFKVFMGVVLILIGSRLVRKIRGKKPPVPVSADFSVKIAKLDAKKLEYVFQGLHYKVPIWPLMTLTLVVGVIGGLYGIGGGAIISPVLVSVWGLPIHTVAGAALLGTFITSIVGVSFFSFFGALTHSAGIVPNWPLGLAFGVGGLLGTYVGSRLQRFLPARWIEIILAIIVSALGTAYLASALLR